MPLFRKQCYINSHESLFASLDDVALLTWSNLVINFDNTGKSEEAFIRGTIFIRRNMVHDFTVGFYLQIPLPYIFGPPNQILSHNPKTVPLKGQNSS